MTYGNGCFVEYDYDEARRLTKITNKKSNGTVISSFEYEYDDVGNVTTQTDKDSNETAYTYDDIYQLTEVDYPSGSDYGYEYDAVGNRTKMFEYTTSSTITTVYSYDNADELTQYTTSTLTMTFTYASDGCLATKSDGSDTWQYVWDYERRIKAFKKNDNTLVEYGYNPTGTRRYASDATVGVTNYFWSMGHVLGDYNSSWSLTRSYILGPRVDEIIAMIDRTTDPNVTHYLTRDRLGSTRELLSASQTINTRYSYDAWGDPTETRLSGSVSTRYRFRAMIYRANIGDKGPYRRIHDPIIGRFIVAEPSDVFGGVLGESPVHVARSAHRYQSKNMEFRSLEIGEWLHQCAYGAATFNGQSPSCRDASMMVRYGTNSPCVPNTFLCKYRHPARREWQECACEYCCICGASALASGEWEEEPDRCARSCCPRDFNIFYFDPQCFKPCRYATNYRLKCWMEPFAEQVGVRGVTCHRYAYQQKWGYKLVPDRFQDFRSEYVGIKYPAIRMDLPLLLPCYVHDWSTCVWSAPSPGPWPLLSDPQPLFGLARCAGQ